jgi:mono/diheme cytochrome c family protein
MAVVSLARRASEGDGCYVSLARRAGVLAAGVLTLLAAATSSHAADSALDLFRQRITPILQAKNPSSCSECHLSGVDLKDYIGKTQEETFAALRDAGLVDVQKPESSKLLGFIARKPEKTSLVSDKVRQQEYEAFQAWIVAACKDPKLAAAKTGDAKLGPSVPEEVIRHARKDQVLASFLDNVWSEIGRCAACHSPDRNQEQVKKHGAKVNWIKLGDPQGTLDHLLTTGIIDADSPEGSLLLLKPTNQVKHGGGVKMVVGDRTYKQFRAFIEDFSAASAGKYKTAMELPQERAEASHVTDIWFKLEGVPANYDQQLLQVDLHRWDEKTKSWSQDRWATGDRQVFGKGQLWQQHLSATAPRGSSRAKNIVEQPTLPAGKYLAKIYIDQAGRLQKDYQAELGEREFVGQVEIDSRWPVGYGAMTIARYPGE